MAVRRQDQCRPEPDLEDPQWHSGTPAPARSVSELEAPEPMSDPRQRDHDTQDREQGCRSDVRYEHDGAGHGPDCTGRERQFSAWALRGEAPREGDDPVEDPVDAHEVHQRRGRAVVMRGEGEPEDDRHHTARDGEPDERHRPGRVR